MEKSQMEKNKFNMCLFKGEKIWKSRDVSNESLTVIMRSEESRKGPLHRIKMR